MGQYLCRRILYAIPILIGVNLMTFCLFFFMNTPDEMARAHLGTKYVSEVMIEHWKKAQGYDLPRFYNTEHAGVKHFTETLFFQKSLRLFVFDFGLSDNGLSIRSAILERMWPSLWIALPTLLLELLVHISLALLLVFFRQTYLDRLGGFICVWLMSISGLFYIIFGQFLFAKCLRLVPISGYQNESTWKFLILPIAVGVLSALGSNVRWYRTLFLEEIEKDYVRTAKAKGLSSYRILFKHVLPNGLIPIVTSVVVILPLLFMGSLILESFFGIPGLGSYTIDAIGQQDFSIVRSMVFLGSVLYIVGLMMTDIAYAWVDPRVRIQ